MANRQNTLLIKRSNVPYKVPPLSGLTLGELALNTADAKLYTLFTSGTTGATEVREIGWNRISRTGDTVTGNFVINGGLTANTLSATTYQNLPVSGLTAGNNININGSNGNFTISLTGSADGDLSGTYPNPTVDGLQGNPVSNITPSNGQVLQWNGSSWIPGAIPNGGSGGGGLTYFLNFQNTTDITPTTGLPTTPVPPSQLGISYSTGSGTTISNDLTQGSYSLVCGFVTISGTPNLTNIPAGLWDFNIWAAVTGATGQTNQTQFQIRVYKYTSGGTYTSLANSDDVYIYDPTNIAQYIGNVTIPQTTLLLSDRIYVELWAQKNVNQIRQVQFYFDSLHPSHVLTTIPSVAGTGVVKVVNGVFQSPASTIVNDDVSSTAAITVSKLSMSTSKILGRTTAGTGSVEEIGLTVSGSSGSASLSGGNLNVPTYTLSGLGGVPTTRNITVNGTTSDLSTDRTFTVTDDNLSMSNITTNDVSTAQHGFVPKATNNLNQYLRGDGTWSVINNLTGLTINGNLTVTGDTSLQAFTGTTGRINGNLTVTGNTIVSGTLSGGTMVITGTTFTGNLIVTGGTGINWISGSTSTDMLRITQVGTGRAFVVEDSANPDFTPFQINNQGKVGVGQSLIISSWYSSTTVNAFLEINSTLDSRDYGIYQAGPVVSLPSYGVFANAAQIGVFGGIASDGGGIGVYGQTGNAGGESQSGDYIGGKFESFTSGGNRYSLQLLDGTEGVGKFLYSVTSDGKANWTSQLSGTSLTINGDATITGSTYTKNLIVTGGTQSIFSGNSSTELVRITQTGSGNAFVVEDSNNPDLTPFVISADGKVGVGTTNLPSYLNVTAPSSASTSETIARFKVGDVSSAYLGIDNAVNTDNIFVPAIYGLQDSGTTQPSIYIGGYINSAQDSGTTPITIFRSAKSDLTTASTRPLFSFRNWTTDVMNIQANGNVGIGTSTPTEKLQISGNTIVSGTISGGTMVITTLPTSGFTTTQILMRNSTSGQVEITDSTSPSIYNYGMSYAMTTFNYLT
jgi:hypothetical protein